MAKTSAKAEKKVAANTGAAAEGGASEKKRKPITAAHRRRLAARRYETAQSLKLYDFLPPRTVQGLVYVTLKNLSKNRKNSKEFLIEAKAYKTFSAIISASLLRELGAGLAVMSHKEVELRPQHIERASLVFDVRRGKVRNLVPSSVASEGEEKPRSRFLSIEGGVNHPVESA